MNLATHSAGFEEPSGAGATTRCGGDLDGAHGPLVANVRCSRHALVIIAAVILHPDWVAPLARDSEEMRWQHKGTMNYNCRTNRRTSWNGSARRRGWAVIADRDLCHSGGPHGHAV
jgi:hypothetical protein